MDKKTFFVFIFLSSVAPQRTAYSEVPTRMAAHLRTARFGDLQIRTQDCRSIVNKSTLLPNELPLLPDELSLPTVNHNYCKSKKSARFLRILGL
jgi:hypothetical protein